MHDMLTKQDKQGIIKKYAQHKGDTGSTQVQIAILSAEVDELAGHLKAHPKDHSSRRGLLKKVGERRRLLRYLKKEDSASFEDLVKKLKLKQARQFTRAEALAESEEDEGIDEDTQEEKEDENK